MKKLILLVLVLFSSLLLRAQSSSEAEDVKKLELTLFYITDTNLQYAASDINLFIQKRKRGFNWPMTKLILLKEDDQFTFEIVAIDNGWANLVEEGEMPHGYVIVGGRIFLIMTRGHDIDMDQYFVETDQKRVFSVDPKQKPLAKNPRWYYLYQKELAYIKKSINTEVMGR